MLTDRKNLGLVALLAGMTLLGGCGHSKDDSAPAIASVASAAPGAANPSPSAPTGPRIRLDTTQAQEDAWYLAYMTCLKDHGVNIVTNPKSPKIGGPAPGATVSPAAEAACLSKKPVFPPELDPNQNPNYKEQFHEDVKCLQRKGMPIVETADGWTYTSSDARIPANSAELERDCQIEAFSKK